MRRRSANWRKSVWFDPDMAEAYQNLGAAFAESGQFDQAQKAFRNALRIRPYDGRSYANLGKLLATKNDVCRKPCIAMKKP